MTEPFFFKPQAGMTVGAIADMTGAKPRGPLAADRVIGGLAPLDRAGPHELTFLDNAKYADGLRDDARGRMPDLPSASRPRRRHRCRCWSRAIPIGRSSRWRARCIRMRCGRRRCLRRKAWRPAP